MRFLLPLFAVLPLAGCYPSPPPKAVQRPVEEKHPHATAVTPAPAQPPVVPTRPSSPAFSPRISSLEISGIAFEGVEFDSRGGRLVVVDQDNGPGSEFIDAAAAARSVGGIAAVNAGFFTPEGSPLGLVVHGGKRSGAWNSASSLGSGLWMENPAGSLSISRRETVGPSVATGMRELIQAGPMLVANGQVVSGLDPAKTSARTLILWDGGHRWWIGRGSPCSLASLAQALAAKSPAGWAIRQALNLDGGRSADLWISGQIEGGPVTRRAPWNRPVRNFLVLVPQ
jgi:hypothetical protein